MTTVAKYVLAAICAGAGIMALIAAACAATGCASAPLPSAADLALYTSEQMACVQSRDTRVDAEACRAESRSRWCARFPASVNCPEAGR